MESMEASSMVLKPCVATKERDSSEFKEAAEPMDDVSSVVVNSYLTKRKAEFDLEEEEQNVGENEEGSDEESKMDEPEAIFDMLMMWTASKVWSIIHLRIWNFPLMSSLIPTWKRLINTITSTNARSSRAR
ncbi:unnamed protein product [Arabidopsis lyrata]|nr:unnamed protein product [Arabidopsis lyrata]